MRALSAPLAHWFKVIFHGLLPDLAAHGRAGLAGGAVMHAIVDTRVDNLGNIVGKLAKPAGHSGRVPVGHHVRVG